MFVSSDHDTTNALKSFGYARIFKPLCLTLSECCACHKRMYGVGQKQGSQKCMTAPSSKHLNQFARFMVQINSVLLWGSSNGGYSLPSREFHPSPTTLQMKFFGEWDEN